MVLTWVNRLRYLRYLRYSSIPSAIEWMHSVNRRLYAVHDRAGGCGILRPIPPGHSLIRKDTRVPAEKESVLVALAAVSVMSALLVALGAPAFDVVTVSLQIVGLVILYLQSGPTRPRRHS